MILAGYALGQVNINIRFASRADMEESRGVAGIWKC